MSNYKKKPITIQKVEIEFLESILKQRRLPNVGISNHFVDRIIYRRIDPKLVFKSIHKMADNICQIIYGLERGKDPQIRYEDFVIKFKYVGSGRLMLATCYQTSNNI